MKEIKQYLKNNGCYKSGIKMNNCWGILIHDTATPGADTDDFIKSWNVDKPGGRSVMVHAFVDNKRVVNTLPYSMKCWGCGKGNKGSGNEHYIQIEMCNPDTIYFDKQWNYKMKDKENTRKYIEDMVGLVVDWSVDRLMELGIKEVNKRTVTSHYEAYNMGIASNHGDPKGLLGLIDNDMDNVREMIRKELNKRLSDRDTSVKIGKQDNSNKENDKKGNKVNDKDTSIKYKGKGIKVKVEVSVLNIREQPKLTGGVVGKIMDRGIYHITEKRGNWGKLLSGAGWINLDYVKEIG